MFVVPIRGDRVARTVALVTVGLALALAGCGDSDDGSDSTAAPTGAPAAQGSPDERQVEAVFVELRDAFFNGDAKTGCAALSLEAKQEFSQLGNSNATCEETFTQLFTTDREGKPGDPRADIVSVKVDGDRAVAVLKTPTEAETRATFVRSEDGWKVASGFLP